VRVERHFFELSIHYGLAVEVRRLFVYRRDLTRGRGEARGSGGKEKSGSGGVEAEESAGSEESESESGSESSLCSVEDHMSTEIKALLWRYACGYYILYYKQFCCNRKFQKCTCSISAGKERIFHRIRIEALEIRYGKCTRVRIRVWVRVRVRVRVRVQVMCLVTLTRTNGIDGQRRTP